MNCFDRLREERKNKVVVIEKQQQYDFSQNELFLKIDCSDVKNIDRRFDLYSYTVMALTGGGYKSFRVYFKNKVNSTDPEIVLNKTISEFIKYMIPKSWDKEGLRNSYKFLQFLGDSEEWKIKIVEDFPIYFSNPNGD